MENATKALLIVGSILITIIAISIIILLFRNTLDIFEDYNNRNEMIEIVEFNSWFERFVTNESDIDSYITAEEVVTIINKIKNWNVEASDDEKIDLTILPYGYDENTFDEKNFIKESVIDNNFKYKCKIKEYYSNTGRVKFIQINRI